MAKASGTTGGTATWAARKAKKAAQVDMDRAARANQAARQLERVSAAATAEGVGALTTGAELLVASDEVVAFGGKVGLLSGDDVADGLELARLAGQIGAVSLALERLELPVLATILVACGDRLGELSAAALLRADLASEMADEMLSTGTEIAALGEAEVAAGATRLDVAELAAERSVASANAGVSLAAKASDEAGHAAKLAATARTERRSAAAGGSSSGETTGKTAAAGANER